MEMPVLTEGRLRRRYKRFLSDIELPGGEVVTAHCPNPGSMKTCAPENAQVWVSKSDDPRRKLAYTWELVDAFGAMVVVNTAYGNRLVAEALEAGSIPELAGYEEIRREVPSGKSRVDFLLSSPGKRCLVEVKSVTLSAGTDADGRVVSSFPDSVTARGRRHVEELASVVRGGDRAVLFFCCVRHPTDVVTVASEIDPAYAEALRLATEAGVEVIAYSWEVTPERLTLAGRVPFEMSVASAGG